MATDNETVDEIVKDMRSQFPPKYCSSKSCRIEVDQPVRKFATRIESAHKREVAELKTAYDRAVSADARHAVENERLKGEVAELTAIINAECRKCGECAKFGKDCTAGDIDGAEDNRACEKFVSREVAELRECLKEAITRFCTHRPHEFDDGFGNCESFKNGSCVCEECWVLDSINRWRKALEGGAK